MFALYCQSNHRAALLGPSAERRTCDADCIVGGCEGEFSVSDGVLCGGSSMPLSPVVQLEMKRVG